MENQPDMKPRPTTAQNLRLFMWVFALTVLICFTYPIWLGLFRLLVMWLFSVFGVLWIFGGGSFG